MEIKGSTIMLAVLIGVALPLFFLSCVGCASKPKEECHWECGPGQSVPDCPWVCPSTEEINSEIKKLEIEYGFHP